MTDLLELVSLQAIDDDLDRLRTRLASDRARLAGNDELVALRARLEASEVVLRELGRRQRTLEAAAQDLSARIEREEKKLYDGSIKQFKELQALEGDIGHVKEERRLLEDQLLEVLAELDEAESSRAALASETEAMEADWAETAALLTREVERLEREASTAERAREAQTERITAGAVRLYEGLRTRKGGKAVSFVAGASCGGCRVTIPDSLRRRILNSPALVQCPQCERILAAG
jgi:predicted  nucleic acid-binding Zn-ribbon protein